MSKRQRPIVYIRAAALPRLYVHSKRPYEPIGRYFPIEIYYFPAGYGEWVAHKPTCLRGGDRVLVRYLNPTDGRVYTRPVDIDLESRFTDDPRIHTKHPDYIFA